MRETTLERTKNVMLQKITQASCKKHSATPGKAGNVVFFNGAHTATRNEAAALRSRCAALGQPNLAVALSAKPTCLLMELGVKELIKLCIYCWGHPLLYTFSGSVAVWMLLSGNLQHL